MPRLEFLTGFTNARFCRRELNFKPCPPADFALYPHRTPVGSDDPMDDGQTQPGSLPDLLCCKKGGKNLFEDFVTHPDACIFDDEQDLIVFV